jgi:hypothetical protein
MKEMKVGNFEDFHKVIKRYKSGNTIYRGIIKDTYKLIPKIGRFNDYRIKESIEEIEKDILTKFKKRARPFVNVELDKYWYWLALAQHHGLFTRLMDWSENPLVAAYFAVEKERDDKGEIYKGNSIVYVLQYENYTSTELNTDPYKLTHAGIFFPPHISNRIMTQSSVFTIQPSVTKPLESMDFPNNYKVDMEKIIILNEFRRDFKENLALYGIQRAALFPDLDVIAQYINWVSRDCY